MDIVRAIDVGYGNVKFTTSSANQGLHCRLFPSWAPVTSDLTLASDLTRTRDTVVVTVDDQRFEVGPDARLGLKAHNVRNLNNEYSGTQEYLALLRGALSYMQVGEIDLLVVGLPVSLMNARGQELTRRIKGVHPVAGGRDCRVCHVLTLAQPLGGFYDLILGNGDIRLLSDQTNLIVDPGHYTVDWVTVHGPKVMPERTGSFPGGVHAVLQMLARSIGQKLGTSFTDIDLLDQSLARGHLRLGGQTIDLAQHWPSAQPRIQEAVNAIANSVGEALDVENIILVGGGANLFQSALQERFPTARVVVTPEPVFANVRGFQLAGERQKVMAA